MLTLHDRSSFAAKTSLEFARGFVSAALWSSLPLAWHCLTNRAAHAHIRASPACVFEKRCLVALSSDLHYPLL